MKICRVCEKELPVEKFEMNGNTRRNQCNSCRFQQKKNRPSYITRIQPKRLNNHLRQYRLTIDDYNEMLEKQNGVCAICKTNPYPHKKLCVDHDHSTGVVRGLLCDLCNRGIGLMRDDVEILASAIGYLTPPFSQKEGVTGETSFPLIKE